MCVFVSKRATPAAAATARGREKTDVGGPTGVQIWGLGKPGIDGAGGAPGKMLASWPSVRVI